MSRVPKAIYDRVIVTKIEDESATTYGNITISDMGKEKPIYGLVVAVGEGDFSLGKLIPIQTKVGDIVVLPRLGPTAFKIGKQEYISLREREIIAFIVEE